MDAAAGMVERGSWSVKEAVNELNWLPNGPISTKVDWRLDGYERVRYPRQAAPSPVSVVKPAPAGSTPGTTPGPVVPA